ncbi:MAG: glycosyltransferase [Burkholderiales bacterium]|nr:glycosyltransferase [Burkholderiales bacterium]
MSRGVFFAESSPNIGGQELQLLQQAQALQERGWAVRLLCRPGSRVGAEAVARGLPVETVRFRGALDLPSLLRVAALAREHRPLALVCHSGHDANVCALAIRGAAALGLLRPRPRPRLLRMRTYQPGRAGAFAYNHLFDASFTPSAGLRAQLLANRAIRPDRVGVLYPAVDFRRLEQADGALPPELEARLAQAGPVVVHAAMLRPEKGHAFMLQVVRALLPHLPGLLYVAAGDGVERARLEEQARRLGIADHVHFPGLLQPVAPLLRRADVVVMPSLYEPLGMSQVEALALGVPVVVSDVGGLPETVVHGETGWICPSPAAPGALQAWTQALEEVLADPAAARSRALRGGARVRVQFDPEVNLQALVRALES